MKSLRQGREMARRNNFQPLHIDWGWRSLFAFKTLIAVKTEMHFAFFLGVLCTFG